MLDQSCNHEYIKIGRTYKCTKCGSMLYWGLNEELKFLNDIVHNPASTGATPEQCLSGYIRAIDNHPSVNFTVSEDAVLRRKAIELLKEVE